jgi:hypothetical protein
MTMYLHLGDQIGTIEARDLAQQLAAWHDAMVRHVRVAGPVRTSTCGEVCPHDDAAALWAAARTTFGRRADGLAFLRTHGHYARRRASRGSSSGADLYDVQAL